MDQRLIAVIDAAGSVLARKEPLPELQDHEALIKVDTSLINPGTGVNGVRMRGEKPDPGAKGIY